MKRRISAQHRSSVRATLLVMLSCFGLGWGLNTPIREAHACSAPLPRIGMQLDAIDGDGDAAVEQGYWKEFADISDNGNPLVLSLEEGATLDLAEVDG